jgi:hypothetical protein
MKKYIKAIAIFASIIFTIIVIGSLAIVVLNSDLYGRMTETQLMQWPYSTDFEADSIPKVTLIVHRYLSDENALEASLVIEYNSQGLFSIISGKDINFMLEIGDGNSYQPFGVKKTFIFADSTNRQRFGALYHGFQSERFVLPLSPSLNGFPFDDLQIRPFVYCYINGSRTAFNLSVQKRIPGRILTVPDPKEPLIVFTRTTTEKWFVLISSVLFLILTTIVTITLIRHKGLSSVEEFTAVAGYIIATAGFREIAGLSRTSGISALEIVIILVPLLSISTALVWSFFKSQVASNNTNAVRNQ